MLKKCIADKTKMVFLIKYFEEKEAPKTIMRWLREPLSEGLITLFSNISKKRRLY